LWQFSSGTVDTLLAVTVANEGLLDRILPEVLQQKMVAGVATGHWIAVLLLIAFAFAVAWSVIALLQFLIRLVWKKARTEPTSGVIEALELPFTLYFAVWLYVALSQEIGISIIVRQRL